MMSSVPLYINPVSGINNSNLKHFCEGKEKGVKDKAIEIARNLQAAGVDINVIQSTMGLNEEDEKNCNTLNYNYIIKTSTLFTKQVNNI